MSVKPSYEELEQRIAAFEESKLFFKNLVDMLPEYVSYIDKNHTIKFANKTYQEFFNIDSDAITGLHPKQVFGDEAFQEVEARQKAALAGHEQEYESKFLLPNGEPFYFHAHYLPHKANGQVKGFLEVVRDITLHTSAKEAIERGQALLASTEIVTKVGGWEWDTSAETMFWTDEAYRIHGFDPDTLDPGSTKHIEKSLECYDPDDRPVILSAFQDCVDKGKAYDLDFPFTKTTGERIWIRTIARPIYENGLVARVIGNIMDVTDMKKLETQLRDSEKMYRSLVEGIPDIIYSYSVASGGIYYSPNVESVLGYSPSQLLQNPKLWYDSIHPEDLPQVDNAICDFQTGKNFEIEYRIADAKGNMHWLLDRSIDRRHESGEIIIDGIAIDITEIHNAKNDLEELNTALNVILDKREEEKNELGENVLRNIENLIQPYIEKLRVVGINQNSKIYLDIIESNLKKLLLPFGRNLQSPRLSLSPSEIRIADLIRNGKTTKEIAEMLDVSNNAVMVHRHHIRKKLNLLNKNINLRNYLKSIG